MMSHKTPSGVEEEDGVKSGITYTVRGKVPSLSSLCFPSIQGMNFQRIDLSIPLPVTRLVATSSSKEDDEDISYTPGAGLGQHSSQGQTVTLSQPLCLKSKRLRSRKPIFYKMGLLNHWQDEKKLIGAVQGSDFSKVTSLLDQGSNPNISDEKKRTPLHIAASQGHHQIVRLLLSKRADPNLQDILGNTPLHLAVCRGDLEAVKVLIENGANIFMRDNSGRTPLSLVRNRIGGLRRNKASSTDAFKSEFILMSEILCSSAARHNDPDNFRTSMDDLCNQMQSVSTREKADEIADVAMHHMSTTMQNLKTYPVLF